MKVQIVDDDDPRRIITRRIILAFAHTHTPFEPPEKSTHSNALLLQLHATLRHPDA